MPSSRKKSNKHLKKPNTNKKHFTSHPNRHSSPALQSQDELDSNILREQNGRNGNCPVKPDSGKSQFLVVEEKKKKGFSETSEHNEMEGSVAETQKVVEESVSEDKQVVVLEEVRVKTIVESDGAQVLAETQQVEEKQDSVTVEQKEEEINPLVEPEKITYASELIVDDIKVLEAELNQEANQEQDSQDIEPPSLSERTNEPSSSSETETSRETVAAVEVTITEADVADKLDSSGEKKEPSPIETNEALLISESSVLQTDVASRSIEETAPIVKPEESAEAPIVEPGESGETKLPAEEQKVEESTVVKESSKEEEAAREQLPPSDVAAAETTSTTIQEKTESQQTTVNQVPREHASWSSCCGIFDFLSR